MSLPLAGRRILVTRAAHQAGKLSDGLRALGAEPIEVPVLEIGPPENYEPLEEALHELAAYDWLIFTSANAVKAVTRRAYHLLTPLPASAPPQIAAVGNATATALRNTGLHVDYIPDRYVAESLIEQFPEDVKGKRILLARAAVARDVIPDAMRAAGALVDVVDAYRNTLPANAPELLSRALAQPLDAATFTSSSTVTHLAQAAEKIGFPFPLGMPAISIGPVTSQTLREYGWQPAAEADPSDIPGLIEATACLFQRATEN